MIAFYRGKCAYIPVTAQVQKSLRERDVCARIAYAGACNAGTFAALFITYKLQFRFLTLLLDLGKYSEKHAYWFLPTDGVARPV
jgi:hypothetical protein